MHVSMADLSITFVIAVFLDILLLLFVFGAYQRKHNKEDAKKWVNFEVGNEVHTIPINDGMPHATQDNCGCSPQNVPVQREDGSVGWQVIHRALDGRE
jgi:hypothetical protein